MLSMGVTTITEDRIDLLTGGLDPQKRAVKLARKRTMKRILKFANLQIARSMAEQTGLPQKAFKGRIVSKSGQGGSEGIIWLGTYRVSPYKISNKVLQNKVGVRAGRVAFAGAFKPGKAGATTTKQVFIRDDSMKMDPARYTGKSFGSGKGFPLVAVTEDIKGAAASAIELNSDDIEDRFDTIFTQELNFALNIEGQ